MQNIIDKAKDWYNSKSPGMQKFIMLVGAIIIIAIISNIISDPVPIA